MTGLTSEFLGLASLCSGQGCPGGVCVCVCKVAATWHLPSYEWGASQVSMSEAGSQQVSSALPFIIGRTGLEEGVRG